MKKRNRMKSLYWLIPIIVAVLWMAVGAKAGIVQNSTSTQTGQDSISFGFDLLDSLGNPVIVDSAQDWGCMITYYPGGLVAVVDSFLLDGTTNAQVRWNAAYFRGLQSWNYRRQISDLDGTPVNGTYSYRFIVRDSSLHLFTTYRGEFTLYQTAEFATVMDQVKYDTDSLVFGASLDNPSFLSPTTASRTLDVSATGEAGVDWANVGSPTSTVGLSNTTVGTVTTTTTATNVTTVNGLASGVITATSIAADAIGASELAADAATEAGLATWNTSYGTAFTAGSMGDSLNGMQYSKVSQLIVANIDAAISTRGTSTLAATDNIGINWADVSNPTSTVGLTNTTVGLVTTTTTATNLTNAPTSGDLTATMKTSVSAATWGAATSSYTGAGTFGNMLQRDSIRIKEIIDSLDTQAWASTSAGSGVDSAVVSRMLRRMWGIQLGAAGSSDSVTYTQRLAAMVFIDSLMRKALGDTVATFGDSAVLARSVWDNDVVSLANRTVTATVDSTTLSRSIWNTPFANIGAKAGSIGDSLDNVSYFGAVNWGKVYNATTTVGLTNTTMGIVTLLNSIATDAITATAIQANAIGASELADNAIDAGAIATDAITDTKIAAGAITNSEIAADAIGASEIATDAIGAAELAADAIGSSEIATDAIGAAEIAAGAITSAEATSVGTATAVTTVNGLAANVITATSIASDAITNAKIATGALDFGSEIDTAGDESGVKTEATTGGGGATAADIWAYGTRTLTSGSGTSTSWIALVDAPGTTANRQFVIDSAAIGGKNEIGLTNIAIMVRDADAGKYTQRGIIERVNCVDATGLCTLQTSEAFLFDFEAGDSVFLKWDEPNYVFATLAEASAEMSDSVVTKDTTGLGGDPTVGGLIVSGGAAGADTSAFKTMLANNEYARAKDSLLEIAETATGAGAIRRGEVPSTRAVAETTSVVISDDPLIVGTNQDKTGYGLSSSQTFNMTGNITGNLSGSVGSLTTNNDKTGYSMSAAGIDAFWDEPKAGHTTAGTYGYYIDSQISAVEGGVGGTCAGDGPETTTVFVYDADDSTEVVGAMVSYFSGSDQLIASTDSSGRADFGAVAGSYRVSVLAGHRTHSAQYIAAGTIDTVWMTSYALPADLTCIDGFIYGLNGQGISGATISAVNKVSNLRVGNQTISRYAVTGVTDSFGYFRINLYPSTVLGTGANYNFNVYRGGQVIDGLLNFEVPDIDTCLHIDFSQ